MLTIKYVWFYVIVFAATTTGIGAGVAMSPSEADIAKALKLHAAMDCEKTSGNTWKRVMPETSSSRGF